MDNKLCLIACAANEKLYIKDWVEYYLKVIKVDKIVIIDNNFSDKENLSKVLKDYDKVKVITDYRKKKIKQKQIYGEMYKHYSQFYKWLMFFDIDEYLVMNNKMSLKSWLSKIDQSIDTISINWKIFDDNDLTKYDKRSVMKRFTRPYVEDKTPDKHPEYFKIIENGYFYLRNNNQVKSIVRGGAARQRYIKNHLHKFEFKNGKYVDSDLKPISPNKPDNYSIDHITYKNCQINHYIQKTIEEYVDRVLGNTFLGDKKYKNIDEIRKNFQRFNKWNQEKEKILQNKCNK